MKTLSITVPHEPLESFRNRAGGGKIMALTNAGQGSEFVFSIRPLEFRIIRWRSRVGKRVPSRMARFRRAWRRRLSIDSTATCTPLRWDVLKDPGWTFSSLCITKPVSLPGLFRSPSLEPPDLKRAQGTWIPYDRLLNCSSAWILRIIVCACCSFPRDAKPSVTTSGEKNRGKADQEKILIKS